MSISIALTKGRIEKEVIKILEKSNFGIDELKNKGRKLVFNDTKEDMEIIIVTTMKFRNKSLKHISKSFLQRYPEVNHEYLKLKKLNSEDTYYFQIINRGALNKYILLEIIYKNCVKAVYTSSAIDNIKIARRQNEF